MILNVYVDEQSFSVEVPQEVLTQADAIFDKMDQDMDKGWQMGRSWVECPDVEQRCRIVADKLLGAIENQKQSVGTMMAAYILKQLPDVHGVRIDTSGEFEGTEFHRA